MALVRQQATSGVDTIFGSNVQATFVSPLTNPSIILIAIQKDLDATICNTPTDTAGNTYILIVRTDASTVGSDMEVWYALNTHTTASNKITVTDNAGGVNGILCIEEWTGASLTNPVDQSLANGPGSTGTAIDTGAMTTTTNANDIIWVAALASSNSNQLSLGTGFTNLTQNHQASVANLGIASKVVAATGSYHGLMTNATAIGWGAIVVAIKDNTLKIDTRPSLVNQLVIF